MVRQAQLAEILNLVGAQGDRVVGEELYHLSKPDPRTLLGKGTSRDIAKRARECGANLLVLDAELTPSQMRNLEDVAGIPICDREAVILNVFLRHAKTRKAKIQVEIAQLEYLRPRIRGVGINMDQQIGGVKGGRGPGETASELLARKLDARLSELKKAQRKFEKGGETQRQQRDSCKRIVLIGYTNAGKTSLMNALTSESLSARDMPFETLDTTSRSLSRYGGDVLLSDTVGFIRRLPKRLLDSFESTLAEIREASLLVIVVDASDYELRQHLEATRKVLEKLEVRDTPCFYIFNKLDRISNTSENSNFEIMSNGHPFIALSSQDTKAVQQLKEMLLKTVRDDQKAVTLFVPYTASKTMSLIYGKCRILSNDSNEGGITFEIQGAPDVIKLIKDSLKEVL
ncbi:UNVERIFIED_CONTAM: hypothetical protein GTU68_038874 [Idotea baltica]|nr:hypothetical protein [Idotea baltica]